MLVRTLEDLSALGRIRFPADESFRSARFLTADDGLGFSYNENRVRKGTELLVWLKHHWEANYIISGRGEVTDLSSDESWELNPGLLYVVGPHDRHRLSFSQDECHISIFFPPLAGNERFDADGSYEPSGPVPKTDRRMFARHVDDLRQEGNEILSDSGQVRSVSLLDASDDIGFALARDTIDAGAEERFTPGPHRVAHHVIAGTGEVTDTASGQTWVLGPSVSFSAMPGADYWVRARSRLQYLRISSLAIPDEGP